MAPPKVAWADVGSTVMSILASAQRTATIVAPFITDAAFGRLFAVLPPSIDFLIITRWTPHDVAFGFSDTRIMDRLAPRPNARLLLHPLLHAKVYVADDDRALVGSANVTNQALGFSESPNREVLVQLEPVPTSLLAFLRRITRESVVASDELRRAIEEAAERIRQTSSVQITSVSVEAVVRPEWLPSLRSPDRLYALYRSLEDSSEDERRAALEDLAEIGLPDGLDEDRFRDAVARHLVSRPEVVQLDAFVETPRRFGELTDWLNSRTHVPAPESHEAAQRQIQTLIRWLLFFVPERYALRQPHYSEVFGRRELIEASRPKSPL